MFKTREFMDKRVVKTKAIIRYSFLDLMKHLAYEDITIMRIVKEAEISRVTFYNHYDNKEHLMQELIDDITADIKEDMRSIQRPNSLLKVSDLNIDSVKIFDHVYRHSVFFKAIVDTRFITIFTNQLVYVLKSMWVSEYRITTPNINTELYTNYTIYALIGLIIEWVKDDFKYSPHYMSEQYVKLTKMSSNLGISKGGEG